MLRKVAVALYRMCFLPRLFIIMADRRVVAQLEKALIANVFPMLCLSLDTRKKRSWLNDNMLTTLPEGVFEDLSALSFL